MRSCSAPRSRLRLPQRDSVRLGLERMSDHLHDPFLLYTAQELRKHFVYSKGEEDPADKYLAHWRDRIER
jgi:hypothetical protein